MLTHLPHYLRNLLIIALLAAALSVPRPPEARALPPVELVFVARAHLATPDDIFDDELGPAGEFGTGLPKFAPGSKLMLRQTTGALVTLVDGSVPSAATGWLIDVQAPDVSFDGTRIVFSGATTVDPRSAQYGWRLYEINANGTGFRQLPIADRSFTSVPNNNPNQYNFGNAETYGWWNDLFPAYMPDGRIVFASSRYPTRSHYDDRRSYNIYLVNADGSGLRRLTTERGGLLHPVPMPDGRILATRWWNQFNQPSSQGIFNRIDNRPNSYTLPDGTLLDANSDETFNPTTGRLPSGDPIHGAPNSWHLMALDPDGTDFMRIAFTPYSKYELANDTGRDTYTAAQPTLVTAGGETYVAFTSQTDSTMVHSTLRSGIRVAHLDVTRMYSNTADAIAGLTYERGWNGDTSPPYAINPAGMPDGTILFSYVMSATTGLPATGTYIDRVTGRNFALQGSAYQYQLYTMQIDGTQKTLVPTAIGTADALDGTPRVVRTGYSTGPNDFPQVPEDDPRLGNIPNTVPEYGFSQHTPGQVLTATIHNPNVYANAPLTLPFINNSPTPGSIAFAQVYVDANQFTGAYCYSDYPDPCATFRPDSEIRGVLWTTVPVSLRGEFTATVPADTPGFIVLRDANNRVVSGWNRGYISIAQGSAWARPGQTVTCVGCHFGHVSGSIEGSRPAALAGLTNVAPYAQVRASSYYTDANPEYHPFTPEHVVDRRGWVPIPLGGPGTEFQDDETGWISLTERGTGEWLDLTWASPVTVTRLHFVGPPPVGGDWGGFGQAQTLSPYYITNATVRFYANGTEVGIPATTGQIEPLSTGGTWITLPAPLRIDRLTFTVASITGKWWWDDVAALNEIEVIGMAAQRYTPPGVRLFLPAVTR